MQTFKYKLFLKNIWKKEQLVNGRCGDAFCGGSVVKVEEPPTYEKFP